MRMKKLVRVKKSAGVKKPAGVTSAIGAWAILLVVICVMGAAMLIAVGRPSQPGLASADLDPEKGSATQPPTLSKKAAASKAPAAGVIPAATLGADATAGNAPAIEPAGTTAAVPKVAPVTITGCLEHDDQTFRLKDTSGVNVPRARSWKSGFLKKGSAPIEVVDASNRLKLPTHVGQRVSMTGVLADREMQVRSVQRVAASCK